MSSYLYAEPQNTKHTEETEKQKVALIQKEMKAKAPNNLTLSFKQTAYKNLRGKTNLTKGQAFFQKPDRFRWVLLPDPSTKKEAEEWRYDGSLLLHYFPSQKEAQSFQSSNTAKDINELVDMILNFDSLEKNYTFQKISGEVLVNMELKPKNVNAEVIQVYLTYHTKEFFVQKIKLFMKGDNWTEFEFEKQKTLDQEFQFGVPSGVKVVSGGI